MRFQEAPLHVKIWRLRHLLSVPWLALGIWRRSPEGFKFAWQLAIGIAHAKMLWIWTQEEVEARWKARGWISEPDPREQQQKKDFKRRRMDELIAQGYDEFNAVKQADQEYRKIFRKT